MILNRLTKKVRRDLADLAKMLPAVPSGQTRNLIAKGSSILSSKPDATNEKGKALDPDKFYQGEQKLFVNHKKNLEREYLQGGTDAINAYIRKYEPEYGKESIVDEEAKA